MVKLLPDICRIQYGYPFDSKLFSTTEGLPLVRIRDVVRGYSETYTTEECEGEYVINNGDLLIGMDGEFNIAKWNGGKALLNQRVCRLFPNAEVDSGYLFYFMPRALKRIEDETPFVTVKHLSAKQLNKIEVPLPDISEQRGIAKMLDKVSDLIALRKQQLAKLDELVKARFIELFGDPELNPLSWPKVPLGNVITNANNGMARRGNDVEGSIVMRLVELQDGYIDYSAPNRIILNDAEKRRYLLRDNDFLFARVNGNPENVGRCAVFRDIGEPVYHNDHIIRVHFDEALINGAFASALFNSTYGKRQMSSQIKTSAGQYTISQDGIGAIVTILPPLSLQERFAALVEQTDKSKSEIQTALTKLETIKKALMQQYFG